MKVALRTLAVLLLLAVASATTGCISVMQADRGLLADPMMSFDPFEDPLGSAESATFLIGFTENSIVYAGGTQGGTAGCPSCK